MQRSYFVGNLPYETTEESLAKLFSEYGTVGSVALVGDRETGVFRGFAYVHAEPADPQKLLEELDGRPMGKQRLIVDEIKMGARASA